MLKLFYTPNGQISELERTLITTLLFNKELFTSGGGEPDPEPSPSESPIHIGTPTMSAPEDGFADYSQVIGNSIIEEDVFSGRTTGRTGLTSVLELQKAIHEVS